MPEDERIRRARGPGPRRPDEQPGPLAHRAAARPRRRARASAGVASERAQQIEQPFGPIDHERRPQPTSSSGVSGPRTATRTRGTPRPGRRRAKASASARSSPGQQRRGGAGAQRAASPRPCPAPGGVSSRTRLPSRHARARRPAAIAASDRPEARLRALGVGGAADVHRERGPLVLEVRARARTPPRAATAARTDGGDRRRALEPVEARPPRARPPAGASRTKAAGRPVTIASRRTRGASAASTSAAPGSGARRPRDRRRSARASRRSPGRPRRAASAPRTTSRLTVGPRRAPRRPTPAPLGGPDRRRARGSGPCRSSDTWLNACGKFPTSRRATGSYSSASSPTSLRTPSTRSNSSRASS